MHRLFRQALDGATGVSQSVIVIFIDIRDFSTFSMACDSVYVAMYLKRVYIKLIDEYFPFASFYKSTGDGLLLVVPIGGEDIVEVSRKVVAACIKCHSEFNNICSDDPMINFKIPQKIGIGVARGTVCCLISGDKVIDYSGRFLNLASRLTDLARSSGIIIDGDFNITLLSDEQRKIFEEEKVYLKGIHEEVPIKIYHIPEFTLISKYNKQPIVSKRWREQTDVKLYRDLLKFTRFQYPLDSEPVSSEDIKITVTHSKVTGGIVDKKYLTIIDFADFTYEVVGGKPIVWVDFAKLSERLKKTKVKKNMNVIIDIDYVEK